MEQDVVEAMIEVQDVLAELTAGLQDVVFCRVPGKLLSMTLQTRRLRNVRREFARYEANAAPVSRPQSYFSKVK